MLLDAILAQLIKARLLGRQTKVTEDEKTLIKMVDKVATERDVLAATYLFN